MRPSPRGRGGPKEVRELQVLLDADKAPRPVALELEKRGGGRAEGKIGDGRQLMAVENSLARAKLASPN